VSSKEGTFFEESGHNSREKNSMNFWPKFFFCCGRSYCTDPYSPYGYVQSYGFGTEIEAIFGTVLEAIFRFSVVVFGPYETVRTVDCGHEKTRYIRGRTAVRFWHGK
jgi:hypothetical protein